MNIALCHYRVGETDGVSLEMEKWKIVLERMGHRVYFLAGSTGCSQGYVIPEMGYRYDEDLKIERNAYLSLEDYKDEVELIQAINKQSRCIENSLNGFLKEYQIDLIIPNNILSLGRSIPIAMAFDRIIRKFSLKCIAHHHDFYWEKYDIANPTCHFAKIALEKYYPPHYDLISHVVINSIAKEELKKRKGLHAEVVPNVFDFKAAPWQVDLYNRDFRERIGIRGNDILMLQATRVTNRKAIELAIDVVGAMNKKENRRILQGKRLYNCEVFTEDSRIYLVLAGMEETTDDYVDRLKKRAEQRGADLLFCNNIINHSRKTIGNKKIYSLWDAYVFADIITYPSILEGWGNQFAEGLFAKKPMLVFEYEVFKSDIKEKGFDYVSLGDRFEYDNDRLARVAEDTIQNAARECMELLIDYEKREKMVEMNFQLGKRYLSLEKLNEILQYII